MQAEIIAVGTEILLGQITNTNSAVIAQGLAELGIDSYYQTVVGDNPSRLVSAIDIAAQRNDLVILAGGLGPTKDDLTKQTLAKYLNVDLIADDSALAKIKDYFVRTGKTMTANNRLQALYPAGAKPLANHNGMAVGAFYQSDDSADFMLLPGPPSELSLMYWHEAMPQLQQAYGQHAQIFSRVLRFFGIGESQLVTELADLIEHQTNPTIAPYAKVNEVTLRLTAQADSQSQAKLMLDQIEQTIRERVGQFLYGYGDDNSLAAVVIKRLIDNQLSITAAESLTAGMFQSTIGDIPGVSAIFPGGFVTYADTVKEQLVNVPKDTVSQYGVVSEQTAIAMAVGASQSLTTKIAVSFTGAAGPEPLEGHSAGTVWIGIVYPGVQPAAYEYHFGGTRQQVRQRSVMAGLDLIRHHLDAALSTK